ncbi:MAG TPA: tail-specific protease, partial [Chitinophagaceae bacterium]|nr:tail-specific protease [Chitinophagaceae bacterium]
MKRLPIVVMFALTGSFLAFRSIGNITHNTNPPGKYEEILKLVGEMISQAHYSPQDINDDFSKKVFKKFMADLDPEKNFFLKTDISTLQAKYQSHIDDEIKGSNVEFFLAAGRNFNQRMEEIAIVNKNILEKPFDFSIDEEVLLDNDKLNFPVSEAERRERWRKKLKFMALERYIESLDVREKNKGKENFVV